MSKTNAFETNLLELIFNNTDLENIGDAAGLQNSATTGSLYVALFSVAPTDSTAGTEAAYGSYARQAVARTSGGWTISGNQASNTAAITFPEATSGSETLVAFGIMTASSGGDLLYYGAISPNISVSTGSQPQIAIGGLTITED